MSVGTATAIALGATAAAGIGSAAIGASGAKSAAQTQAQAANQASQLQYQEFLQQQANLQPWLKAGRGALSQLSAGTQPGGAFSAQKYPTFTPTGMAKQALQPATYQPLAPFQVPTAEQAAAMPGYQFAYNQGLQALQRSQAATGITGGAAAKAAEQYGQGLASTNYQQAYQDALNAYNVNQAGNLAGYQTNLGAAQGALGGQQNVYGTQVNAANTAYNRLASLAGIGQTATEQANQAGQNYASNVGNLLTSAGAAQAAGTMGAANAYGAGLGTIGNAAQNYAVMNALFGGGGGGGFNTGQSPALTGITGEITSNAVANALGAYAPTLAAPSVSPLNLGSAYVNQFGGLQV